MASSHKITQAFVSEKESLAMQVMKAEVQFTSFLL